MATITILYNWFRNGRRAFGWRRTIGSNKLDKLGILRSGSRGTLQPDRLDTLKPALAVQE